MWMWYKYAGAIGRHVHVCQGNIFGRKAKVLNRVPYSGFFFTWSKYNLPLALTRKEWESIWDLGWKESCAYIRKKQRSGTNLGFVQVWVPPISRSDSAWGWGPSRTGEMICHCILALQRGMAPLIPFYFHDYSPAGNGVPFLPKA